MLCEKCKQRPAKVAIHEHVNGQEKELYVCQTCAKTPLERELASMVEIIFDVALEIGNRTEKQRSAAKEPACTVCGMTRQEFRRQERLGCEACYTAFRRDTEAMIRDMHQGKQHQGKMPAREVTVRVRTDLEHALREAVETQRFEDAARLRDRLAQAPKAPYPEKEPKHAAP